MCLLAKIWYTAQIFPPSRIHAQQLTTICAWFIWQGATFRIPMTTLQLSKYEGGWDFPNIEFKCKTLLYNRLHMLATTGSSITSEFMWQWDLTGFLPNPAIPHHIPTTLAYLRQYGVDMAYILPCVPNDSRKTFKRRIYQALLHMNNNA
jgi:hypothetical protein